MQLVTKVGTTLVAEISVGERHAPAKIRTDEQYNYDYDD